MINYLTNFVNDRDGELSSFCRLVAGTVILVGIVVTASPVLAKEGDPSFEKDIIEEVVVTARRRSEDLQRTPLSISAFSAQIMNDRNIENLRDLTQFTPNVLMVDNSVAGPAAGQAFIRGIGQTEYFITADPGVGVYVDDVYMARSMGLLESLLDVERIEVLRGPQGTLYGKNTIGGAIRIISTKPTDELSAKFEFTGGSYSRTDLKTSVNLPLNDHLFMNVAFASTNRDGYGRTLDIQEPAQNRVDGIERGDDSGLIGRIQLRWLASENLTVDISLDGSSQRSHMGPGSLASLTPDGSHALLGILYQPALTYREAYAILGQTFDENLLTDSPFVSRATGPQQANLDVWGINLTADWRVGDINITSITAYRDLVNDIGLDIDSTPFDLFEQEEINTQDQFSQEIRIGGVSLDERLNWVIGGYYFRETAERFILGHIFGDFWRAGLFPQVIDTGVANTISADTESLAAFGQGTFNFTEQLSVTAGVRITDEKKSMTGIQRGFFTRTEAGRATVSNNWTSVTPRFGLEYQWTTDVMTYLSAANGFKSGGYTARLNAGAENAGIVSYDPEYVWTYEAGIRSKLANGRVQANLTGFYSEYEDIQVRFRDFDDNGTLLVGLGNVATARITGAEFDLTAVLAEDVLFNLGIGYIDAEYTSIGPEATAITKDSKFPRTPKWSYSVGAQYTHQIATGSLFFRTDYSYRTKTQASDAANDRIDQKGYGLLSGRLAYKPGNNDWQVALYATNIADERYVTGGLDFAGLFDYRNYGRPREWGLQVSYEF